MDVWVFGYGSLIFRADFSYTERRAARLRGFSRRFWQASPDHRGTPEAPGRVVTLIPDPRGSVIGAAYRITAAEAPTVLAELDYRERAGYERITSEIEFVQNPRGRARAIVYQALRDNPNYGELTNAELAAIIRVARGPSGDNTSYVRQLAAALRALGEADAHVFEIERLLDENS
ncbi:MAG TPA: gamma-glutamylcyclotransferase [Polyangiaceae bacterium]